ncbi:MAG: cyclic pyranopterin monophosphate synthase MoaC [Methanomicrobiaceae archaeon]|nr:cyclic pyranopterin monophosphate synthase MoaC [Methanomicrobiaceae archaeon]
MAEFTHIKDDKAYMVDVTQKPDIGRIAVASGKIYLRETTLEAIRKGEALKGNVLATARVAGIQGVKETSRLIPMCHPLPIGGVSIDFEDGLDENFIEAICTVKTYGKTGVEMEALTGVSIALLTIWDMVKSAEKDEEGQYPETGIEDIHVVRKEKYP